MGTAKKIKLLLVERECTQTQLAKLLGTSRGNLHDKLTRDNFSERDLAKIAELLDCDLDISFIMRDNGKRI